MSAHTTAATNKNNGRHNGSAGHCCPICCRKHPLCEICTLTKCKHKACRSCIKQWIEKVETSWQSDKFPGCPFCRKEIQETEEILGRAYNPFQKATKDSDMAEPLDELTSQWLQEHTRACPGCNSRIEKVEGGCDLMECLCGCRFCFGCGSYGSYCLCTGADHVYWDNYHNRAVERFVPPLAEANEESLVDLGVHVRYRQAQIRGEAKRNERAERRNALAKEEADSTRWLFHTRNRVSIKILGQLLQREKVKLERARKRRNEDQECSEIDRTALGHWMFWSTKKTTTWIIEKATCEHAERVRKERAAKRKQNSKEFEREQGRDLIGVDAALAVWLFKKKTAHATRKHLARLYKHFARWDNVFFERIQQKRVVQLVCETEYAKVNVQNVRLLFLLGNNHSDEEAKRERAKIARLQLGYSDVPAHTTADLLKERNDRIEARMRARYGGDWEWTVYGSNIVTHVW